MVSPPTPFRNKKNDAGEGKQCVLSLILLSEHGDRAEAGHIKKSTLQAQIVI